MRISSPELDELIVRDRETIDCMRNLGSEFPRGWQDLLLGPPAARLSAKFYVEDRVVDTLGVSHNFLTRTRGGLYSRPVGEDYIRTSLESCHKAVLEAVVLTIPEEPSAESLLYGWVQRLEALEPGSAWSEIQQFAVDNAVVIEDLPEHGGRSCGRAPCRNLRLQTVYEGDYVDTAITAQLALRADSSLERVRLLGFEHAAKVQ